MKPITEFPYSTELLTDKRYFWNCRTSEELEAYYKKLARRTDNDLEPLLAIVQQEKKLATLIRTTVPTMPGWCSEIKSCAMASLVIVQRPKEIIEIGVFGGRSLIPMAMAMKQLDIHGKIIGIDPYSSDASARDETGDNAKWWGELNHEAIKQEFLGYVKRFELERYVTLVEKTSDSATPTPCDLLHIDGNHSEQAVRDAQRYGPMVRVGGIAICDDKMWSGGGVLRAIDALENMGFIESFSVADWIVMQRVK